MLFNILFAFTLSTLTSCTSGGQLLYDPLLDNPTVGGNTAGEESSEEETTVTEIPIYNENSVGGTVTIQFNDGRTTTASSSLTRSLNSESLLSPSTYKVKLISAYLAEDIDPETESNIGQTFQVFENEECNENIRDCDISNGTNEDGDAFANIVTSYFDLSDPETVNNILNSQRLEIIPGTYRYARLEFSKYNSENSNNVIWAYAGSAEQGFYGRSGTATLTLSTPITIDENSAITFLINYTLPGSITAGSAGYCTTVDSESFCFTEPEITPDVIVNN